MPALRQRASICTRRLNGRARRKGGAGAFCGSRCRAYSPGGGSSEGCRGGQEAAVVRQFDEAKRQVLEQVAVETRAEEVAMVAEVVVLDAAGTCLEEEMGAQLDNEARLDGEGHIVCEWI